MRRITKILVITAVGAGIVGGAGAFAKRHGYGWHGGEHRAEHIVERVSDKLELDAAQSEHLRQFLAEIRALRDSVGQNRRQLGEELIGLLAQPRFDQQRLIDIVTEKTRAIDSQAPRLAAALGTFTDSLDGQQKAELTEYLERRLEHGRRWHHHDHDDDANSLN